jgi:lipid-A-disaccharide synthase-like uncharacterized protein
MAGAQAKVQRFRSGVIAVIARVIATMDGDGQNDPADIMRLCVAARTGWPRTCLVGGLRKGRKAKGSRKAASRFANWIRDKVLAGGCPDTSCGLKVYRREDYLVLPYFTSMHRHLPALFLTYGHELAYEPVNDRPRLKGASKYTNLGRVLIGLYNFVGVSWLRKRTLLPPIAADPSGASAAEKARASQVKVGVVEMTLAHFESWWTSTPMTELVWITIGFIAQFMFSMRFIVQWVATEKARASIIPRMDPVFIVGQAAGLVMYACNIYFIWLGKRAPSPSKVA